MKTKYVVWTGGAHETFYSKENALAVADYWEELGYEDVEVEEWEEEEE